MTIATKASATALNFNNAFLSKTSDDATVGKFSLRESSSADVENVQLFLNTLRTDVDSNTAALTVWEQEVPTGLVNDANVTYTLSSTPRDSKSVMLYLNGLIQFQTTHYTISVATITMITAPAIGQDLYAIYDKG